MPRPPSLSTSIRHGSSPASRIAGRNDCLEDGIECSVADLHDHEAIRHERSLSGQPRSGNRSGVRSQPLHQHRCANAQAARQLQDVVQGDVAASSSHDGRVKDLPPSDNEGQQRLSLISRYHPI